MKPTKSHDQSLPPTEKEIEDAARRFEGSELGRGLASAGVPLYRRNLPTNFKSYDRISSKQRSTTLDFNYTIMGTELFEVKANQAQRGHRQMMKAHDQYLDAISPLSGWHFWQKKAEAEMAESRAAVQVEGQVETLDWYQKDSHHFKNVDPGVFKKLEPHVDKVLEYVASFFTSMIPVGLNEYEKWSSKMNYNRNSGWPYMMPISQERWESVDWQNFKEWLMSVVKSMNQEQMEELMSTHPSTVRNANHKIYTLFHRPPDRIIHGVRLLLKGPGACFTKNSTNQMKGSAIGWASVNEHQREFAHALGDATAVSADDLKKFDRSLHPQWFKMIYERFWDSPLFEKQPELRMLFGMLMYELTQDADLQLSATHYMVMDAGLWSGHPLTQFVGSIIHLILYEQWKEDFSMEPTLQKVLSDDGIQIYNDMTPTELDDLIKGPCSDSLKEFGMLLHPDKSVVTDPTNRVHLGQFMGEEFYDYDIPFFLKQHFSPVAKHAYGNPIGVTRSILQVERAPTDAAFASVINKHLVGFDQLELGGTAPKAIYDLARIVDILASSGLANPLIEDQLHYVRSTWPGFERRGVDYLTQKLSPEWREGTTFYAGGTLDSGLSRGAVVEALLEPEENIFWDERNFRV